MLARHGVAATSCCGRCARSSHTSPRRKPPRSVRRVVRWVAVIVHVHPCVLPSWHFGIVILYFFSGFYCCSDVCGVGCPKNPCRCILVKSKSVKLQGRQRPAPGSNRIERSKGRKAHLTVSVDGRWSKKIAQRRPVPRARLAVRKLFDLVAQESVGNTLDQQVAVCEESIEWSRQEKRTFLRHRSPLSSRPPPSSNAWKIAFPLLGILCGCCILIECRGTGFFSH